jgi:hypothetical protein
MVLKGFNPDSCALAIRLVPAQSCSKRSPFPHIPATPFPSFCGIRLPTGLPHNDGLAIRAAPGPFSPLCGIPLPIELPHNERIGDPGGSGPFLPLWITPAPLGLTNNERFGNPGGSRPLSPLCATFTPRRKAPTVILSLSKDLSRAWRYKTCEPSATSQTSEHRLSPGLLVGIVRTGRHQGRRN